MGTLVMCFNAFGIILFSAAFRLTESDKLLVIPQDGSCWLAMSSVVEKLAQRSPNSSGTVFPDVHFYIKNMDNVTVRTFPVPLNKEFMESIVKMTSGQDIFQFSLFYRM